jgi:catechol 2,3-dioxygenase-like lactoylglutathione lyase family enzyme
LTLGVAAVEVWTGSMSRLLRVVRCPPRLVPAVVLQAGAMFTASQQIGRQRGKQMTMNLRRVDVVTLFVEDVLAAKQFYQEIFELPVIFENEDSAVLRLGELTINLLDVARAPDLIGPATVASRDSGSRFQFTVEVDDVDLLCAELASRGVKLINGPMDRRWGVRTAAFADPGGHIWEIAQDLPRS